MKEVKINIANPAIIYIFIWSITLLLYSFQFTSNLQVISDSTLILVLSNILSILFWAIMFICVYNTRQVTIEKLATSATLDRMHKFVYRLLAVWLIGTIFEIISADGIPLLWVINQTLDKNYATYGIPTLHGMMNSIFLFSETVLFIYYLVYRKKKDLFLILLLLLWPILALARSVLVTALFQMCGVYLLLNKLSMRRIINLVCIFIILIIAFGVIGDIRGISNVLEYLIVDEYQDVFQNLPSGFLWCYVYITSPLSNINANIDNINPSYIPNYSIANLLPTAIRQIVNPNQNFNYVDLVDKNLNVSTFYVGYLYDFGIIGAVICVMFLQFIVISFYYKAQAGYIWAIVIYAVFFQCIISSIFYDLFTHPVYIAQIILAGYFAFRK